MRLNSEKEFSKKKEKKKERKKEMEFDQFGFSVFISNGLLNS